VLMEWSEINASEECLVEVCMEWRGGHDDLRTDEAGPDICEAAHPRRSVRSDV
jgi:hypothetical protein